MDPEGKDVPGGREEHKQRSEGRAAESDGEQDGAGREGKEGGLSYILKNRDRELEASRPRCRRFLLQRAQRPGPSFLKPLPLLPSLLEQCGAQAAAVEDRPAAAAPAAAEKEGGKHKAGCELRAAR